MEERKGKEEGGRGERGRGRGRKGYRDLHACSIGQVFG